MRTTLQALSAVLGGAQSLHTNGLDEAFTIPSEQAMKVALPTQQIIADESRVPNVVDPLGGSYYVEALTDIRSKPRCSRSEEGRRHGRHCRGDRAGFFQRGISDSAYEYAKRKASGEQVVVGVNKYVEPPEQAAIEIHRTDPTAAARQFARLADTKKAPR